MLSDDLSLADYAKGLLVMYDFLNAMSEERNSELAEIKAKYDSLIIGFEETDPIEIATFENRLGEIKNEQSVVEELLNMAFYYFKQRCLEIPVCNLELSVRTYTALARAGIKTLGDIAELSPKQLRRIRNIGELRYAEIVSKLNEYTFHLNDENNTGGN